MALQLQGYKFNGIAVPIAYLRIVDVSVRRAGGFMADADCATVSYAIYTNQAARQANTPLLPGQAIFKDSATSPIFSTVFKAAASGSTAGLSAMDLLITQAYAGLAQHPDTTALLTGATRV